MQHTHLKWLLSQHKGTPTKYAGWDSNGNPAELDAPEGSSGVPTGRTLTINGVTYDLSANRTWTVGDLLSSGSYTNPSWIVSLAWSKISSTPTTRAGYGITDAEPTITAGTSSQYYRGDKTWQTFDHGALAGLSDNDHPQYELVVNKNIAGGYAGLTASTLIAAPQLGSGTPDSSNYLRGDRTWSTITYSDVGAAPSTGSTFITTLGTISTGVWQGSVIDPAYLGSGVRDGTKFLRDDGTWQTITGGSGDHTALSNLSWLLSGHTSTSNRVAGFDGSGNAALYAIGTDLQGHSSTLDSVSAGTYTGSTSIVTLGTINTGTWNATTIDVTKGGTGFTTASEGDIVVGTNPNVLGKLSAPTSGQRNGKTLGWVGDVLTWVTLGVVTALRISTSTNYPLTGGDIYVDNADGNATAYINATVP